MDTLTVPELLRIGLIGFAIFATLAFVGAIALLVVAARQIADIEVPPNADFFETLQLVPITVPLALDLLDFTFDIFSAPIAWVILELLGLQSLQMITVFEGIIPGTQIIPTMTIAWFVARMLGKRQSKTRLQTALHDYQLESESARYDQLMSSRRSLADNYRRQELLPGPTNEVIEADYFEEIDTYGAPNDRPDDRNW